MVPARTRKGKAPLAVTLVRIRAETTYTEESGVGQQNTTPEPMTHEKALANSVRLLEQAEFELDLAKMERIAELGQA